MIKLTLVVNLSNILVENSQLEKPSQKSIRLKLNTLNSFERNPSCYFVPRVFFISICSLPSLSDPKCED